MNAVAAISEERRIPCPKCGVSIIEGARKCRGCRSWIGPPPSGLGPLGRATPRALTLILAAVAAVAIGGVMSRESPVEEAPPLTAMATGSSVAEAAVPSEISPAELEPALAQPEPLASTAPERHRWSSHTIRLEARPLDLAFGPESSSLFVTAEDMSLREYDLDSGRMRHLATMPAQGDRIRVLHDRWLAVMRLNDASHVVLVDTHNWDRVPWLLWVGGTPADIIALPDGKTAVAASSLGKRLSWFDLTSGKRIGNIKLPHRTEHLFLLRVDEHRANIGAMGILRSGGRSVGAWLDLFDPSEEPFGATRRSISVGRDPRPGAVSSDGSKLFFADYVSNSATLLSLRGRTESSTITVGQAPVAATMLAGDRYGVTLDSGSRTATVIDLSNMTRISTLMLDGEPHQGATSADGSTLFVSLGGSSWPPKGSGAAVVAGEPPRIVHNSETGRGAARVAASRDGRRGAIANYYDRSITIIER